MRHAVMLCDAFAGSFEYCALKSAMGRANNCFTTPGDQKIAYAQR
jgi:hypothetical protein